LETDAIKRRIGGETACGDSPAIEMRDRSSEQRGPSTKRPRTYSFFSPVCLKPFGYWKRKSTPLLFVRASRGVVISPAGADFWDYARPAMQQAEPLEEKYLNGIPARQRFFVSTQHDTFTAAAFSNLSKEFGAEEHAFTLRETKTCDIIDDVKTLRSELGVIDRSAFNETVLRKLLQDNHLIFTELFVTSPHVFISRRNPLAGRTSATLFGLEKFSCLTCEQGEHNSFYFSEEILSTLSHKKTSGSATGRRSSIC
jgi:DNA-binding transcriptional LysR family regulator